MEWSQLPTTAFVNIKLWKDHERVNILEVSCFLVQRRRDSVLTLTRTSTSRSFSHARGKLEAWVEHTDGERGVLDQEEV